jgi:hypothetical protein
MLFMPLVLLSVGGMLYAPSADSQPVDDTWCATLQGLVIFGGVNPQEDLADVAFWAPSVESSATSFLPQSASPSTDPSPLHSPAAHLTSDDTAATTSGTTPSPLLPTVGACQEPDSAAAAAIAAPSTTPAPSAVDSPMPDLADSTSEQVSAMVMQPGLQEDMVTMVQATGGEEVRMDVMGVNGVQPMEEDKGPGVAVGTTTG